MYNLTRPQTYQHGNFTASQRTWIFFGFCAACLLGQALLSYLTPRYPEAVSLQLKRQEFIVSKIIEHIEDEDFDDDEEDAILADAAAEAAEHEGDDQRKKKGLMSCLSCEDRSQQKRIRKIDQLAEFPVLGTPYYAKDINPPLSKAAAQVLEKKKTF
jgi:hypothetical protein